MDDLSFSINQEKKIFFAAIESKIEENKAKLSREPGNVSILKELAAHSARIGMYDLSVYFATEVLNYEPDSLSGTLHCLQYLLLNGQEIEAQNLVNSFLKRKDVFKKEKKNSREMVKLVQVISKVFGDKKKAILFAQSAIDQSSKNKDFLIFSSRINQMLFGDIKVSRSKLYKAIKNHPIDLSIIDQWMNLYIKIDAKKCLNLCKTLSKKYPEFEDVISRKKFFAYSSLGEKQKAEKCMNEYDDKIQFLFHKIGMDPEYLKKVNINELLKIYEKQIFYAESLHLRKFNHPLALLSFVIARKYKSLKNFDKKNYFLDIAHKSIYKYHYFSEKNNLALKSEMPDTLFKMSKIAESKLKLINHQKNLTSPIFIIGLPRSGSTLIEKIVSQKKEIMGFGECQIVKKLIFNLTLKNSSPSLLELYKNEFKSLSNSQRFVDKTLNNFPFIGIILKSFPNAKFINCMRDSKENALAIYNILFDTIPWAHTLESILNYMDKYYHIINKFRKKFASNIYNIRHQNLVNNPEREVSKLFKFLDIKYDPEVLNNKNNPSQVCTASNWQVREKISSKFLKKYTNDYYLLNKYYSRYEWLK